MQGLGGIGGRVAAQPRRGPAPPGRRGSRGADLRLARPGAGEWDLRGGRGSRLVLLAARRAFPPRNPCGDVE
eukprot:10405535-Lingulodinium_polyedra.AAC.1